MTQRPVNPAPPDWMTSDFVQKALAFASAAHAKQVRKYSGEPYIYHPIEVATILVEAFPDFPPPDYVLAAALLHDTVEDCEVSFTELRREFGDETACTVLHLTDLITKEQGNRETRKFLEVERLRNAPREAQCVKLADMISNTTSICAHDPDFAVVYLREKERALDAIGQNWADFEADSVHGKITQEAWDLYNRAVTLCRTHRRALHEARKETEE